ncbi:MAG: dihydrolipoyl dehydrogenase [Nitrospinae bacterium]|nr:dihydrolipoyl dehydrogenase [Nitrospinota bacterium]
MERFDVVVIGGGAGGYSTAVTAAGLGLSTALIEIGDIGGACLNRGCVPAKAWISSAETVDMAAHMATLTREPLAFSPDFGLAAEKQRAIVAQFKKSLETLIVKKGVQIILGRARFQAPGEISVETAEGPRALGYRYAVIATGSAPARLFNLSENAALTSDTIFNLSAPPKSLLIVGGGAIGCEFAGAMSRFGVEVTVVELLPRLLPTEDFEVSATLEREFKKRKIKVVTGTRIEEIAEADGGVTATLAGGVRLSAEKVLISVGRRFVTEGLGLENVGVTLGARGEIDTDGQMRTSARNIFAVGDVAGKHLLAYTAYAEGRRVAEIIGGVDSPASNTPVPNTIFTIPEIGSVGVTEGSAPEGYVKGTFMFRALARAHAAGEIAGFVKVVSDGASGRILGVHIIGPRATDLIHIAAVAMAAQMTVKQLGEVIFSHPTFSEALLEAVHDTHGASIHK